MFGRNFLNSKEFLFALASVRVAAVYSATSDEFYTRLGFVNKDRLENVRVYHPGHPDITCRTIDAILTGKSRPDTYMLKHHSHYCSLDETGTKKHRVQPAAIMRALAFMCQDVPLPFLYKSERGQCVNQSYLTNENSYVASDGSVLDLSGTNSMFELSNSDYEWTQVFWSPSLSTYHCAANDFDGKQNLYSCKYDMSTRQGFMQSSSRLSLAGCQNSMALKSSSYFGTMRSAEFHILKSNSYDIYEMCKDMCFGNSRLFLETRNHTRSVCGYVGAKYSKYHDELTYGGNVIDLPNASGSPSTNTSISNKDHLNWLSDLSVDVCDGNYYGGRTEIKFGTAKADAVSFLKKSKFQSVVNNVFGSYDDPNDGSFYSKACKAYINNFAKYSKTMPTYTKITVTNSTSSMPTGTVSPVISDELKYLDDVLNRYASKFSAEENSRQLPWTSGTWDSPYHLRSKEYVEAVKMFVRSGYSKSWATCSCTDSEGYFENISKANHSYHVMIAEGSHLSDLYMMSFGYKDGNTADCLYETRAALSEEYSKDKAKFPNTWKMLSSNGFQFSSVFIMFCKTNKDDIVNAALGVKGIPCEEKLSKIAERPKPDCPSIDGVVGMEEQVAAFHSAMSVGKPSMLVGPTGCGKTFLVRQYHKWDNEERKKRGEAELPLVIHTFHQESSPTEIIGKATLENGNVTWQESEFMKVFSNGGTYFADEFNFAPGGAHAPLFAALNGDEDILVPEAGKTYKRHKDFKFVAACNPASKYGGRQPVDKALASRFFVSATFGYLSPSQEKKLLMSRIDTLTSEEAEKVVSFARSIRKAEKDGHLFIPLGTRDALHIAELLRKGFNWADAVEYGFAGKSDNEEQHDEIMKLAGSDIKISFDSDEKLKETVKKLKETNAGLQSELTVVKNKVVEYSEKLAKFKAALS